MKKCYLAPSLVFAIGLVLSSFYFEYGLDLTPCPLCIMQRLALIFVSVFLLLALLMRTKKALVCWLFLSWLSALMGAYFAGRQVYLQSLPIDSVPACGPGFNVMLQYFPWQEVMQALFFGSGSCAKVSWQWLGLSMAQWSLAAFIGLNLALVLSLFSVIKNKS